MPNYDYHCDGCDVDFEEFALIRERHLVTHAACGELAHLVLAPTQKYMRFHEGFFPHMDKEPVYASSKRQLKDECKKRDVSMPYAWD